MIVVIDKKKNRINLYREKKQASLYCKVHVNTITNWIVKGGHKGERFEVKKADFVQWKTERGKNGAGNLGNLIPTQTKKKVVSARCNNDNP